MIKKTGALILLTVFLTVSLKAFAKSYPDVPENSKYYEAVDCLSDIGVVAGYEDGSFIPDRKITRGEAAALLARTLGFDDDYVIKKMPFTDIKEDYWAEKFISFCWERGLINGMDGKTYAPAENVTYAQTVKMLVCASGLEKSVSVSSGKNWYDGYLTVAEKNGITDNVSIVPNAAAPRGDVAILVYNCIERGLFELESGEKTDKTESDVKEEPKTDVSQPYTARKEDVVKSIEIPAGYSFSKNLDYNPNFDEKAVDFEGLPEISEDKKLLVIIDPGHNFSGIDVGAKNDTYGVFEQNITLPVAKMLGMKLEKMGFDVVLTRDNISDNVSGSTVKEVLMNRVGIANGLNADLFVSVHCNAGGGKGVETYCYKTGTKGETLAKLIQKQLAERTGLNDRGVKTAGFVVIKETVMPAVLIETAFIDNENDLRFLTSIEGQNKISTAAAMGIYEYAAGKGE